MTNVEYHVYLVRKHPERDALFSIRLWEWAKNNPDPGPKQTKCHWKCQGGNNLTIDEEDLNDDDD